MELLLLLAITMAEANSIITIRQSLMESLMLSHLSDGMIRLIRVFSSREQ